MQRFVTTASAILSVPMQVGVRLVQRAGFDIHKSPTVWDDFAKMSGRGSEMLSVLQTHPASSNRKKALEQVIQTLVHYFVAVLHS